MADQREREIAQKVDARVKEKLPNEVDRALESMSSYRRIRRTGWVGAGILAVGIVGGGLLGFDQGVQRGTQTGAKDERARLFPRGELTPEVRDKLAKANHSIVIMRGLTAASLREAGWEDVPDFPFQVAEGQPNPDTTPSIRNWIAVGGIYLPTGEDDIVGDLTSDINAANLAAGRIDPSLAFKPADISEFLEADLASLLRPDGQTIFQSGHVVTSHQVIIDGVTNGIAIGRTTPDDPISYITFDATKEAPLPPGVSAGGFIVAK